MHIDAFISSLVVQLGTKFNEEQLDFIKNFDSPGICMASPGTGKTSSAVAGLLTTELYKSVPGENIYALSFTNMATLELELRHQNACKKLGISNKVQFQTLHKLCSKILRENYRLLDMEKCRTSSSFSIENLSKLMLAHAARKNIKLDKYDVRNVVRAVRALNSSLTFTKKNVEERTLFKDTKLTYEEFMSIRKCLYDYNKIIEKIQVDDIMLYTLELLLKFPEVSEACKKDIKILLVDEAQDLSLLQLRIVSLLTDNPILIGDIKQQIYGFNGACQEIVSQFYKYFPNAWTKHLTQSYRCKNEIADFATSLILPNKIGNEAFSGTGYGGKITIEGNMPYSKICKEIQKDYLDNNRKFSKDILFCFRNNLSCLPLAEEFYRLQVPIRINRYQPAHTLPVVKDLCALIELAQNPRSLNYLYALGFIIPEFRKYDSVSDTPFYRAMSKTNCELFDMEYTFKDQYQGETAMELLLEVHDMVRKGSLVVDIFNKLYPMYFERSLKAREHYLESPASHYMAMASYAVRGKTYTRFIKDEIDKDEFIKEGNRDRYGVRCYTFHASKGLEADVVYMLDCDVNTIPNTRRIEEMERKDSYLDVARTIRNERALVYVAATRAKEELHIYYRDELSTLLSSTNIYSEYDELYSEFKPDYSDVEVFKVFSWEVA